MKKIFTLWIYTLSGVAGFLNATTIYLFATTSAHITGVVTRVAQEVVLEKWDKVIAYGLVLIAFFLGCTVNGLINSNRQFVWQKTHGWVLLSLAIGSILSGFLPQNNGVSLVVMVFLLGIQNSLFVVYKDVVVRTTHFTGYLTDAGFVFGQWLRGQRQDGWKIRFFLMSILSFSLGGGLAMCFMRIQPQLPFYMGSLAYVILAIWYFMMRRYHV